MKKRYVAPVFTSYAFYSSALMEGSIQKTINKNNSVEGDYGSWSNSYNGGLEEDDTESGSSF